MVEWIGWTKLCESLSRACTFRNMKVIAQSTLSTLTFLRSLLHLDPSRTKDFPHPHTHTHTQPSFKFRTTTSVLLGLSFRLATPTKYGANINLV